VLQELIVPLMLTELQVLEAIFLILIVKKQVEFYRRLSVDLALLIKFL
jgi:hypothetical protein